LPNQDNNKSVSNQIETNKRSIYQTVEGNGGGMNGDT